MFDLRYHVASLAAVFVALVIGILVGVGLASRGSLTNPERATLKGIIADRDAEIASLKRAIDSLSQQQTADEAYIHAASSLVMANRLRHDRIGIVFVGPVDSALRKHIAHALLLADAPPAARMRAVKVPIDPEAIDRVLAKRPVFERYLGDDRLRDLGRALGEQIVVRAESPLWSALAGQLVEEDQGAGKKRLDGVVVVRSVAAQKGATARFLAGFYKGLASAGVPAVGVEATNATNETVEIFQDFGLSTVDDVDTPPGELALVLLLSGAEKGHYGVKGKADSGVLPPLEPTRG